MPAAPPDGIVNHSIITVCLQDDVGVTQRPADHHSGEDICLHSWAGWEALHWADALCQEKGTGMLCE